MKRELAAIAYFLIFFSLIFVAIGVFFEFLVWPGLAWLAGAGVYHLQSWNRLYKWSMLMGLMIPLCTLIMWFYEKREPVDSAYSDETGAGQIRFFAPLFSYTTRLLKALISVFGLDSVGIKYWRFGVMVI